MSKHPLTAVIDQAKDRRSVALDTARRVHRRECPFQRSRGVDLVFTLPHGDVERECGQALTVKGLLESIARVRSHYPDASFYLDGGVDGAASLRDFDDGNYDPFIEEWSTEAFTEAGLVEVVS